jgi:hypothetical protein
MLQPRSTYRGRGEIREVYLPSQLEYTATLLGMVDRVKGGGRAPSPGARMCPLPLCVCSVVPATSVVLGVGGLTRLG